MACDERSARPRLICVRTLRGEPFNVEGRKLTPVARVITFGRGKGMAGQGHYSGWGAGFVRTDPVAIIEETEQETRCISITNETDPVLRGLAIAGLALVLLCAGLRRIGQRRR
jgi:uncharacterized spore protein YtfJ